MTTLSTIIERSLFMNLYFFWFAYKILRFMCARKKNLK